MRLATACPLYTPAAIRGQQPCGLTAPATVEIQLRSPLTRACSSFTSLPPMSRPAEKSWRRPTLRSSSKICGVEWAAAMNQESWTAVAERQRWSSRGRRGTPQQLHLELPSGLH